MSSKNQISRRGLLGRFAIGTAALGAGGSALVPSRAEAKEAPLPWPYKKLNLEEVGEIAYNGWYSGLCMNAVLSGIMVPLRKSVGEPYTSFPLDSFVWGHGGVVGWGTMCGTMIGASVAANLICGPGVWKGGEQVANEVIHYYADTQLPVYKPKQPKVAAAIATSKSNSPLCHVSVNRWMEKTDHGFWSPERKDRCARLAADIAMKTAALLNDYSEGKFKSAHPMPAMTYNVTAQHNCNECHGAKVPEVVTTGNPAVAAKKD